MDTQFPEPELKKTAKPKQQKVLKQPFLFGESFKTSAEKTGKGNGFFAMEKISRIEVAPGTITISVLANSFLYGLGFTALVDFGTYMRFIAFDPANRRYLVNRLVRSHKEAVRCIAKKYIATALPACRSTGLMWTCFYRPDNQWWMEKTRAALVTLARRQQW